MTYAKRTIAATALALGFSSMSWEAHAMDPVEQLARTSYDAASVFCYQYGAQAACQQLPRYEQSVLVNNELRRRCQYGDAEACRIYQQTNADAQKKIRELMRYWNDAPGGNTTGTDKFNRDFLNFLTR